MNLFKKLILPLLILVLLSTGLSFLLKQQKPALAQAVCEGTAPSHSMLVIDRSGSMKDPTSNAANAPKKLAKAKEAAVLYVNRVKDDNQNTKIGVVRFGSDASLASPMNRDWNGMIAKINDLTASGETCALCGLRDARAEMNPKKQSGIKNVIVFLTDGKANEPGNVANAEAKAKELAQTIRNEGTIIYSIGLGSDVNEDFLKEIAGDPSRYFRSPTTEQLNTIFGQIAQLVGTGSISGFVYNDANGNGSKDSGEVGLPGWTVTLSGKGSKTSADDGSFVFDGLCNGNYTLSQTKQNDWVQTQPANDGSYTININGSSEENKNFGNQRGAMTLNFILGLDGVGKSADHTKGTGDFSNRALTFGTGDPVQNLLPTTAQVCLYLNAQNDSTFCQNPLDMVIGFNGSTQLFHGSLPVSDLTPGNYSIKVKVKKYLVRKVGSDMLPAKNLWTLAIGNNAIGVVGANQRTHSNLMVGDIDNNPNYGDNQLGAVDYGMVKECLDPDIFDVVDGNHCVSEERADLNADGKVDQVDLNYFIRESRNGD